MDRRAKKMIKKVMTDIEELTRGKNDDEIAQLIAMMKAEGDFSSQEDVLITQMTQAGHSPEEISEALLLKGVANRHPGVVRIRMLALDLREK